MIVIRKVSMIHVLKIILFLEVTYAVKPLGFFAAISGRQFRDE